MLEAPAARARGRGWRRIGAGCCVTEPKTVYPGSIPGVASSKLARLFGALRLVRAFEARLLLR